MTVTAASLHITSAGATAQSVRRFYAALFDGRQGIATATDLAVTENGTPDMSVDVAAGACLITGDESSSQGAYWVDNIGTLNVTITAADATNPRKDLIVAKVQDSDFSGATDAGSIVAVAGTPAGSPAEPAVPDNAIVLAMVDVAANETAIEDAHITDRRTSTTGQDRLAATGGIVVAASTAQLPTSPTEGLIAWQSDTNQLFGYNGSAWVNIIQPEWQAWTPDWFIEPSTAQPHTVSVARYMLAGDMCTATWRLVATTAKTVGQHAIELPFTMRSTYGPVQNFPIGVGGFESTADTFGVMAPEPAGSSLRAVLVETDGTVNSDNTTIGDEFTGTVSYEIA